MEQYDSRSVKNDGESDVKSIKTDIKSIKTDVDERDYKDYDKILALNEPKYCPAKDSPFYRGQKIPFSFLVKAMQLIEKQEGQGS